MAAETAADRLAMLSTVDWAETIEWTHGAATSSLPAIIDDPTVLAGEGDALGSDFGGPGVLTSRPALLVRDQDIPAGAGEGDTVAIGAVDWTVRQVKPDGTGMTIVLLERP